MSQSADKSAKEKNIIKSSSTCQFSTFYISNQLYGIAVSRVQEVVRSLILTPIPLAPEHVRGLINLRGQVATAIGLRQLFGIADNAPEEFINVVCKVDGTLISLQVDEIGDVIEVSQQDFEPTPDTVPYEIRRYMKGIYKISDQLLSALDLDLIGQFLSHKIQTN